MTAGRSNSCIKESKTNEVINQLQEISGASLEQVQNAYSTNNGDIKKALTMLTQNNDKELTKGSASNVDTKGVIEIKDDKDDDLAKAIELSLKEANGAFGNSISEEDKEISKVLEASLIESRSGNKRKRGNIWHTFVDPEDPYERKRKDGLPVGLKNVGNTCWFSAVIQALFHIPKFRKLVLNCKFPQNTSEIKDQPKLMFLLELQKLFALLFGSDRKYVNPAKTIEIFEDAVHGSGKETSGDQQDVSEFTHVLLDWLEEVFKSKSIGLQETNPISDLFYGRFTVDFNSEGGEIFGAIPLRVRGHQNINDSLEDAMIRVNNSNSLSRSIQEHWFTHLPVVLTFDLSRFIFNQHLSRTEKIHDQFHIDKIIYLARYMEYNRENTREKRKTVNCLRKKKKELIDKLEKYTSFGSKSKKKVPLSNTLDSTMEFIKIEPTKNEEDNDNAMSISPRSSPNSKYNQNSEEECILTAANDMQGPSPKNITENERTLILNCLRRWRSQVEEESNTLKRAAEFIDNQVQNAYEEESMKQVPYRLHAILIHEGQANGGHYWSYVFDNNKEKWFKFNDMTVSEATWDEIICESIGGYRNTCAYCLLYVDASETDVIHLDSSDEELPGYIKKLIIEDNDMFSNEIQQWDAKISGSDTKQQINHIESSNSNKGEEGDQQKQIDEIFSKEIRKCLNIPWQQEFPLSDQRLESAIYYYVASDAPKVIIDRALLENFIEKHDGSHSRRALIQHAESQLKKLQNISEQDAIYNAWRNQYQLFLEANACFVTGVEAFYIKRFSQALPYLMYSVFCNEKLINSELKSGFMHKRLLAFYRRKCLQLLNDEAYQLFQSNITLHFEESYSLLKQLILPSLPFLTQSGDEVDFQAVDGIREKWFSLLGNPSISDVNREMFEDILTNLIDENIKIELKYPAITGPLIGSNLLKRYRKIMKESNYCLN